MALKIKDGVNIWAYGPKANPFNSESKLTQDQLEHLKSRFPNDIEEDKEVKVSKSKNK